MSSVSQKPDRLLVCTLDHVERGDRFEKLPLHVTIQQWFSLESVQPFYNAMINHLFYKSGPIVFEGGGYDEFGPKNNIPVRLLEKIGGLASLHVDTGRLIKRFGEVNTDWPDYSPHVTYSGDLGLARGMQVELAQVQLIRRTETVGKENSTVEHVFTIGHP